MRLERIRIKNFRSIKSEVFLELNSKKVIVGPNNSGKTNILRSIYIFFNSLNYNIYNVTNDMPFGSANEQTSITAYFLLEEKDSEIRKKYLALNSLLESPKEFSQEINLYLTFSPNGKPTYRLFPNDKILQGKAEQSRSINEEIVTKILDKFSCKYIPSEKDPTKIYNDFLVPHLKSHIGSLLQDSLGHITSGLNEVSDVINKKLHESGIDKVNCTFGLPNNMFSEFISGFDFYIDDGQKTKYLNKGSGIQAATSLSFLCWVNQVETQKGRSVIWLIEEPESYLHPGLIDSCSKIIDSISSNSQTIITTHAIGFVPARHEKTVETQMNNGETSIKKFANYSESTESIRRSLGLRFSDFYNLSEYNIFVEGKTDKLIIEKLLSIVKEKGSFNAYKRLRQAAIVEFSGVSKLKDFLKSTYAFMAPERRILVVFDGDEAGKKASNELVSYFRNKEVQFRSNKEYILLPNGLPIEGLFPIQWLEELSEAHNRWITVEKDVSEKISSIIMDDKRKSDIAAWLINKAEKVTDDKKNFSWASDFMKVFNAIEKSLEG